MQGETLTLAESMGVAGLTNPRGLGLERVAMRAREASVTLSAWRLAISSEEGEGAITLVELPSGSFHRGDGLFLGWPQDRLAIAYEALIPKQVAAVPEIPQLG